MSSNSQHSGKVWTSHKRLLLTIATVVIAVTALLASAFALHIFGLGTCGTPPANLPSQVRFTVVITFNGYNGSKYHGTPWPKMNVTLRQNVAIHVWNNDTQAHGFAITHYSDQGVPLQPSDSSDLSFQACQTGAFPIYETLFTTNYVYLKAELNVSP